MAKTFSAADIRKHHFRNRIYPSDMKYMFVANDLMDIVKKYAFDLPVDAQKWVALKTTLYFEDIVSELGVWASFVKKNKELYGTEVPFFPSPVEYYINEPNFVDVQYIVWSAFADTMLDSLVNPTMPLLQSLSLEIFDYLDSKFDQVPVNDDQVDDLFNKSIYDDFLMQRDVLKWIFLECYLTRSRRTKEALQSAIDSAATYIRDASNEQLYYAAECTVCFSHKIGPHALYPKDYLAGFLNERGMTSEAKLVSEQVFMPMTIYKAESYDKDYVHFVAPDGDTFKVPLSTYDDKISVGLEQSPYSIGSYVSFNGQYQTNGMSAWGNLAPAFEFLKKKKDFHPDHAIYDRFMELSLGEPFLFAKTAKNLDSTMKKLGIEGYLSKFPEHANHENYTIYVSPETYAVSVMPETAKFIKLKGNKLYDAEFAKEYSLTPLVDYKMFNAEATRCIIEKDLMPDAFLNSYFGEEKGREVLQANKDFLARFYRQNDY